MRIAPLRALSAILPTLAESTASTLGMDRNVNKTSSSELLGDLTWARNLALQLVGEAFVDDVLQETRLAAWQSAQDPSGSPKAPGRPWFRVVLRRFALQRIRSEEARKRREERVARPESLPSPAELSARLEQQQLLGSLISKLREPYRSTLLLRYSKGLEPKEIATRLSIPGSTVRSRIKSAIDMLREQLDDKSNGDRSQWLAALCPLLRAPSPAQLSGPPIGVALTAGSLVMKKLIAASLIVLLAGLSVYQLGPFDSAEPELAWAFAGMAELAEATTPKPVKELEGSEESPRQVAVAARDQTTTLKPRSGWWLTGQVEGIPEGESGSTELRVRGENGSTSHTLLAGVSANGAVRVDLSEIFGDPNLLPTKLRVFIKHPGRRPAEQQWNVNRDQRQAGFIVGASAVFELRQQLLPPRGLVRGTASVPIGYDLSDLGFSLIPVSDGTPSPCAIDQTSCNNSGEFSLTYSDAGIYHVLVTHAEKLLAPEFVEVTVSEGETLLDGSIELDEGAIYEGYATMNGARPAYQLELQLSRRGDDYRTCDGVAVPFWHDSRYHSGVRTHTTQDSGYFRITGMAAGTHNLRVEHVRVGDEIGRTFSGIERITRIAVELPNRSSGPNFEFQVKLFACVSNGIPLSRVNVLAHYEVGAATTVTGTDGRIALICTAEGRTAEIEFQLEGYESVRFPLVREPQGTAWKMIDMASAKAHDAVLVLELRGDSQRTLERFTVRLQPEGQVASNTSLANTWRETSWKRRSAPVRIEGITPGSYRLLISADDPTNGPGQSSPDTGSMILRTSREIRFFAGEERKLSVDLRSGGRLLLSAICPNGCADRSGSVGAEILDSLGKIVESHWVSESGPGGRTITMGQLMQRLDAYLEPPLEPGQYSLRVWPDKDKSRALTFPFQIVRGEVTRLEIVDPR